MISVSDISAYVHIIVDHYTANGGCTHVGRTKNTVLSISGPLRVGKSPLDKAFAKFFLELRNPMQPLVLYHDHTARPGELDGVDYHFRSRDEIENLKKKDQFIVMDVRGDLQALDLQELLASIPKGDVFFETKTS